MKRIVASKLDSMSQEQLEDYISDRLRAISDESEFALSFSFIGDNMYSVIDSIETIESNVNNLKAAMNVWKNKGFPIN